MYFLTTCISTPLNLDTVYCRNSDKSQLPWLYVYRNSYIECFDKKKNPISFQAKLFATISLKMFWFLTNLSVTVNINRTWFSFLFVVKSLFSLLLFLFRFVLLEKTSYFLCMASLQLRRQICVTECRNRLSFFQVTMAF